MSSRDLTQGRVLTGLLVVSGPMVLGLAAVLSQSLVDAYFVGQLGTAELAALSFTFPVARFYTSLSIGLSAGASSVVSREIGSADGLDPARLATQGLLLTALLLTILSAVGYVSIRLVFGQLGASGEVLDLIERYMRIWYASMPFLAVAVVAHGSMRASGNAVLPSMVMAGSALVNIGLTPALMYGWGILPELGIEGVALATWISRIVNLAITLALLFYGSALLEVAWPDASDLLEAWQRILKIAVPAAVGNATGPVGSSIVTAILARYGDTAVAAFGVATRVESLACLPMLALSAGIGPVVGQNWGAEKRRRVVKALQQSFGMCFAASLALIVAFFFAAEPIAGFFAGDEEVTRVAADYLRVVSFSLWGYGIVITAAAAYNALGKSKTGLLFYALWIFVLYAPLAWLAARFGGKHDVFLAIAIANGVAGAVVGLYSLWWLKKARDTACDSSQGFSCDLA